MAQYRQSGMDRYGVRDGGSVGQDLHNHHYNSNGVLSDQVNIGIRGTTQLKQHRARRSLARSDKTHCFTVGAVIILLSLVLVVSLVAYYFLSQYNKENEDMKNDPDFLTNDPRITNKVLKFGKGLVGHGRDSRYWDKDDRRRDKYYDEDVLDNTRENPGSEAIHKDDAGAETNQNKKSFLGESTNLVHRGSGLYNEAGRHELNKYEAEYVASLRKDGQSKEDNDIRKQLPDDMQNGNDIEDDYDDNVDPHDDQTNNFDDNVQNQKPNEIKSRDDSETHPENKDHPALEDNEAGSSSSFDGNLLLTHKTFDDHKANSRHESFLDEQSSKKTHSESKRKSRRRKSGSCDIKFLNSTSLLVEPPESRKFTRFTLQYTGAEEKPIEHMQWVPRFAGHQGLEERENSFMASDQKINCGFVKGPREFRSTGFDLAEDDASYISRCHIAVISCIFGNSDQLRMPASKTITHFSKKNVCFVMFVDEVTLRMLSSEGHEPDRSGFIGLWRIVVVRNLPYDDMRRVGKIPKLLSHRLFPSARYSIWLDSKLRLQLDPLLLLEYFLWRKGYEYAISNHYDRHCVWEEVAQNKKLNKFNHTFIDQQFSFYQADGLTRFSSSDPNKLLPSNVPEGSFIIRAHTPMSNLFSCLWFNEVDRFTPRDQLSFAYTFQKLRRMNPEKPFHLNMFKDCERRAIAKLFRHRSDEKRNSYQKATE